MNRPFPAYRGADPYLFICYAHSDAEIVYSDLVHLEQAGVNIWYDEGIPAGSLWRAEIAAAIKGAEKLVFFISKASLRSAHCLREVDYAVSHDIEIVPVYLEDIALPDELALVLNRVHGLFRQKDSMYKEHLLGAVRGEGGFIASPARGRRKRSRVMLTATALALLVLTSLAVFQWVVPKPIAEVAGTATGGLSAYDSYLEGLKLLERWDKGDNLDRAVALFRESTALDPDFALAYARLADALRIRYALTRDSTWLDQAIDSIDDAVRLGADLGPVQVALGRIQATRGNFDLATAALERALAIDPNDATANQAIAGIYAKLGRPADAESYYRKAIALDPNNPTGHDAYGNFLSDQGRYEDAIGEWQTVLRLAPDHYAARVNLGAALSELGRWPEAITMYRQANEIRPSYMAYSNLGTAYSMALRYPEAVEAYTRALELNDSDWLAWGNLAYVYSWMGDRDALARETFEKAIDLAEAAKTENPREPFVHSDLGLYYAQTGRPQLALQHQETAVVLAPDSGLILVAAAEVFEVLGMRERAIERARSALAAGLSWQSLQRNPELAQLLNDPRMQQAR